jgi:hypothetical protein
MVLRDSVFGGTFSAVRSFLLTKKDERIRQAAYEKTWSDKAAERGKRISARDIVRKKLLEENEVGKEGGSSSGGSGASNANSSRGISNSTSPADIWTSQKALDTISKIVSSNFAINFFAGSCATILSGPWNYARNRQYHAETKDSCKKKLRRTRTLVRKISRIFFSRKGRQNLPSGIYIDGTSACWNINLLAIDRKLLVPVLLD